MTSTTDNNTIAAQWAVDVAKDNQALRVVPPKQPTQEALDDARKAARDLERRVDEWEALSTRDLALAAPAILQANAHLTGCFEQGLGMRAADMARFLAQWKEVTDSIPPGVLTRLMALAEATLAAKTYHVGAAKVGAGGGKRKLASGNAKKKQEAKAWARALWEGWHFCTGKVFSSDVAFAHEVVKRFPCVTNGSVARWPGEWRKEERQRRGHSG
ncbi:hypothetical protein [Pseudoxanthomonas beigongshangi]